MIKLETKSFVNHGIEPGLKGSKTFVLRTLFYNIKSLISKLRGIGKFKLHLQSVSIMLLLQIQSDVHLRNDIEMLGLSIQIGILCLLVREARESLCIHKIMCRRLYLQW